MKTKNLFLLPALIAVLNLTPASRVTAQTFTTLHSFTAIPRGLSNSDGATPYAGLIANSSGNTLYGTASAGGISSVGTVFALNTDGTGFRSLHSFILNHYVIGGSTGSSDCAVVCANFGGGGECFTGPDGDGVCECAGYTEGANPVDRLVLSGNTLYGTTANGGSSLNGTVFAVNTDGNGFTNLYSFTAVSAPYYTNSDGAGPIAGLILSGKALYGTAQFGGSANQGTVFALNTDDTGFTTLHSFTATHANSSGVYTNNDGVEPHGGLILSDNILYGTAGGGGSSGNGTVFAVNTDVTGFTVLHSFNKTNSDGANPWSGLVLSGNTLYGTAYGGGSSGGGTVFAVNTDGTGFTVLHSFNNSDGANPWSGLVLSGTTLYGTTYYGGVFALKTDGTGFTVLHSFTATDRNTGTNSDGAHPLDGLILSGNTLYGTAFQGGSSGNGTVFSISFRPQLTITPSGTNVILSWPTNVAGFDYTGYTLQSATNLGSPVWSTNSPVPIVVNGQNTVTNPISGTRQFFRLSQ